MNAMTQLENWDYTTPDEDRKEVYEVLMAIPEFARFLDILKEQKVMALTEAQYAANEMSVPRFLGVATAYDRIIDDIKERTADSVGRA